MVSQNTTLKMKRLFDLFLAINAASAVLLLHICIVAILVRMTSKVPSLYWSDLVGIKNTYFKIPKFRSMKMDAAAVSTHLRL